MLGENTDGVGLFRVANEANKEGHRAAAVPGVVAILCTAHERFGRLPLARLMEPAIRLAVNGWPVDWLTVAHTANAMRLLQQNRAAAAVFLPQGRPPAWGPPADTLVQPDLAETLRRVARDGADGFYRGEIAEAIAHDMRRHDGWINRDDLARYPRLVERPVRVTYRNVTLLIPAMPCGATTMSQTLRILETFDMRGAGHNTAEGLHLFIEAARRALADRFHYLGDPEHEPVPVQGLLSEGHARELASLIRHDESGFPVAPDAPEPWVRFSTETPPGNPWRWETAAPPVAVAAGGDADEETCTTHFAVADRDGAVVSCTITAAGMFGSGVMTPGTGILWNNGMTWFNPLPGTRNSIAPGKRPLTNMAPTLLLRDGRPWVAVGAPGGRKIVNAIAQVVSNVVDHGMSLQQAITAPRIDASAKETIADIRIDPRVLDGLRSRGHRVTAVEDSVAQAMFSRPLGIMIDQADGTLRSGLSPFHMTEARAVQLPAAADSRQGRGTD